MSTAKTTRNHDEIRQWVEQRGGFPARVAATAGQGGGGILRIDYDEPGGDDDERLERIGWDEFFRIFDAEGLLFLHQDETESGAVSRFSKFVDEAAAER